MPILALVPAQAQGIVPYPLETVETTSTWANLMRESKIPEETVVRTGISDAQPLPAGRNLYD